MIKNFLNIRNFAVNFTNFYVKYFMVKIYLIFAVNFTDFYSALDHLSRLTFKSLGPIL